MWGWGAAIPNNSTGLLLCHSNCSNKFKMNFIDFPILRHTHDACMRWAFFPFIYSICAFNSRSISSRWRQKIQFENVIEMMTMGETNAWLSAYMFITHLVSHTATQWHRDTPRNRIESSTKTAHHTMTMASDPGGVGGDGELNNNNW